MQCNSGSKKYINVKSKRGKIGCFKIQIQISFHFYTPHISILSHSLSLTFSSSTCFLIFSLSLSPPQICNLLSPSPSKIKTPSLHYKLWLSSWNKVMVLSPFFIFFYFKILVVDLFFNFLNTTNYHCSQHFTENCYLVFVE